MMAISIPEPKRRQSVDSPGLERVPLVYSGDARGKKPSASGHWGWSRKPPAPDSTLQLTQLHLMKVCNSHCLR